MNFEKSPFSSSFNPFSSPPSDPLNIKPSDASTPLTFPHIPSNPSSYKELYLTSLPAEPINPIHFPQFFSKSTKMTKEPHPKFCYTQSFAYNNSLFLLKVCEDTLIIYCQYLTYNPKRSPLSSQETSLVKQSAISQRFYNQRLVKKLRFPMNISQNLCFGSLDYHPYVIIPLINGQFFVNELTIEDYLIENNEENFIKGSYFELNINGTFLLGVQNISNLFKDQEKAWNLVMVCSLSNGILGLYEASIQANWEKIQLGNENNMNIPLINPHSEINLFYSGLFGKLKNYSDYYLKNSNDFIIASLYLSNYLCFVLTKEMVLKLVNIYNRNVILETTIEDFKENPNKTSEFWPCFKLKTHDKSPFIANEEGVLNIVLLIGEVGNLKRNYVKFLNVALNIKKFLYAKNKKLEDFDWNLMGDEDICFSAEFTINENLHISSSSEEEIIDFAVNSQGIFIASFEHFTQRNKVVFFDFNGKKAFKAKNVINYDEKLDNFIVNNEKKQGFYKEEEEDIEKLFKDQRFPTNELEKYCGDELFVKKGYLRGFIKENFRGKKHNINDFEVLEQEITKELKLKNRIICLFIDKNHGLPIVFREKSINCLIPIDFIEEFNERNELLKGYLSANSLNKFMVFTKEIGFEFFSNKSFELFFQMNLLLKSSLQISQEKLVKNIRENNKNDQSFLNFLSDFLTESLHLLNSSTFKAIKEIHKRLLFSENFDFSGFLAYILSEILLPKFEENHEDAMMNTAEFPLPANFEEWSSFIYALCANKLKVFLANYTGFCLDLLVLYLFLERFTHEFLEESNGNTKKNDQFLKNDIEKLSRICELFLVNSHSLSETVNNSKESSQNQIISDLLEGDQFIDNSKVFLVENHMNLLESSRSFSYSKSLIWLEEYSRKIRSFLLFVNMKRLEIDYVPKLMKFFIEKCDFEGFLKVNQVLKLKNPAIEFFRCLALNKSEDFFKINQSLNYVNSFVNFEKFPLVNREELKEFEGFLEKRLPLCLGPWFVYQQFDDKLISEGSSSVLKLQNMLLEKFFVNKTIRSFISFNASCFAEIMPEIKLKFMREMMTFQMNQRNYLEALNIFIFSLGIIQHEKNHHFFFNVLEEFYKAGQTKLLIEMPLDDLIYQKIKDIIIAQSQYHLDIMISSLQEKTVNSGNLQEISQIQQYIWDQYASESPLIQVLLQFYLEKSGFEEAIEVLLNHLKKLLRITMIKVPLCREFYIELLKSCESFLRSLIFVFDLQNPQSSAFLLNSAFFQKEFELNKQEKRLLQGIDIESEDTSQKDIDLAYLFNKIGISEGKTLFSSDSSLKKDDFRRFLKKMTVLCELVSKIEFFEDHRLFSIEMDSEILIRYLIKTNMIDSAVDFVIVCDISAKNLMVYLSELYYKLSEGGHYEDFSKEEVWKLIEKIIYNSDLKKKKDYCRVCAEKILRNHLQRELEDEIPAGLFESYLKSDPVGLILLYIKYKKIQKAGLIVLNYIKKKIMEGNKAAIGKEVEMEDYIPPNVILTVMGFQENHNVKIEIENLLGNLRI